MSSVITILILVFVIVALIPVFIHVNINRNDYKYYRRNYKMLRDGYFRLEKKYGERYTLKNSFQKEIIFFEDDSIKIDNVYLHNERLFFIDLYYYYWFKKYNNFKKKNIIWWKNFNSSEPTPTPEIKKEITFIRQKNINHV